MNTEDIDFDAEPVVQAETCEDCDLCARAANSDATTPGFFYDKCENHRAVVLLPLEPNESQGAALSSADARQDEQRAGGILNGQPQSSDEPQRSQESTSRRNDPQMTLLHVPEWWEEHWKGMPEYVQEDFMPYKSLLVHFETREDYARYAEHIGQRLLPTTKSTWWPEAEIAETAKLRYMTKAKASNGKKEELQEILEGP